MKGQTAALRSRLLNLCQRVPDSFDDFSIFQNLIGHIHHQDVLASRIRILRPDMTESLPGPPSDKIAPDSPLEKLFRNRDNHLLRTALRTVQDIKPERIGEQFSALGV